MVLKGRQEEDHDFEDKPILPEVLPAEPSPLQGDFGGLVGKKHSEQ